VGFSRTRRLVVVCAIAAAAAVGLTACNPAGSQPTTPASPSSPTATVTVVAPAPITTPVTTSTTTSATSTTGKNSTADSTKTLCNNEARPELDLVSAVNTTNGTVLNFEVTCLRSGKQYVVVATMPNRQTQVLSGILTSARALYRFSDVRLSKAVSGTFQVSLQQCSPADAELLTGTEPNNNGLRVRAAGPLPSSCKQAGTVTDVDTSA